jgi:ribosomal protein S18 acetylase RimI-like enzyme
MLEAVTIEQVTKQNYHMFYDMVSWRMNNVELTQVEKEKNESREFIELHKNLDHPGFYTFCALCEGRFVGWISIMYTPKIALQRWSNGVIYIDELWVAPEFRRKGIAKQLMEKAFECQKNTDAIEVRVYVGDDNIPAQQLYKKTGLHIESKALYMKSDVKN